MENYLYFAEADVETGDDGSSEALCVPASSYIGADPGSGTTTLRFKNAMGDNAGVHTVVLTHTAGKNKEVMRGVMACINAHPSEGGFVVVANSNAAAVTAGTEYNKVFNGLGMSTVAITEVETGGITGASGGTTESTSYGAGAISTEIVPQYSRSRIGNDIITTILVDLTGLAGNNDEGDVIGLAAGGAAYIGKYVQSETGIIHKVEMTCLEVPTSGSNNLDDIDLRANSSATAAATADGSGYTALIAAGGSWTLGETAQQLVTMPAANDYLYLIEGAASGGANTFTAGKYMIKLYGHPTF
jgi:hypothetical protein|tara:strand:- start:423 stop:1325 length:903 start_codon:yes stop_codon:yes gene_type:complete